MVAFLGKFLTNQGMSWYNKLNLPSFTPSGEFIGLIWTIIFILTTISALIFYNTFKHNQNFNRILTLFILNAFLNVFWTYLFFYKNLILFSLIEMIFLEISIILLIFFMWKKSRFVSSLLFLYALWVLIATYLTVNIYLLNS